MIGTRLEALIDQIPLGIILVRARSGTVAYANRRAEEIVGRTLLDSRVTVFHTELAPCRSDGTTVGPEEMLTTRVLGGEGPLREERLFKRADGRFVATRATAAPIRDKSGQLASVVLLLDEAIGSGLTLAEEEHHDHERDFFVGMLGHDLRAPLASVLVGASLMHRNSNMSHQHMRVLERMIASAERVSRMIERTLEFARTRLGGGIPLKRGASRLREVLRGIVTELPPLSRRRVVLDMPGIGAGCWDDDRMAQVVSNLVGNALQRGDCAGKVRVSLHDEARMVLMKVHNTGQPIPTTILGTIFDPFRRPATGSHGIGLGLYIAHEIVRAHGGTITVESTEAEGTTFTVRLPRQIRLARAGDSPLGTALGTDPALES